MNEAKAVLKKVLEKIRPSKEEREKLLQFAKKALRVAKKVSKEYGAEPILAGSLVRDTWLTNKKEIDLFVMFPEQLSKEKLEAKGLELGKKVVKELGGKVLIKYAQHPYVIGLVDEFQVEIVPCYKLKDASSIKSAVDRTPFHVEYLKKKLKRKHSDEVRLLKQFLKANELYGADAKTEGFSGYLCELLVIHYGSFLDVLKAATEWKPGEVIDVENHWKGEFKKVERLFKGSALIVIDPVDKKRNVASALSAWNFFKFKKLAKQFLEKPSEKFFVKRRIQPISYEDFLTKVKERGTKVLFIVFKPPEVVPDVLWPQLRRATKRLISILHEYEFSVHRHGCWTDEKELAVIALEMEVWKLPSVDERIGPSIFDELNSRRFLSKYSSPMDGPYVRDDRWVVEVKREWTDAKTKLVDSLSKDVEVLKAKGIPSHVAESIAVWFDVADEKTVKKYFENKAFRRFLKRFLRWGSLV